MGGSLNQPSRVKDEGIMYCKLLEQWSNKVVVTTDASTLKIRIG